LIAGKAVGKNSSPYGGANLKVLVFSDIHNNLAAVKALRCVEENSYDALIVAGDLGNKCAHEMLKVFETFGCPVFFVLGNWDDLISYDLKLPPNCHLVHNTVHHLGDYWITGHSGCWVNWGQNPIFLSELREADKRHTSTLQNLEALTSAYESATQEIDAAFQKRRIELSKTRQTLSIADYRKAGKKLRDWKASKYARAHQQIERFMNSPEYSSLQRDRWECADRTNQRQRAELVGLINDTPLEQAKLILLTHDRLYKLAEDRVTPMIHIFGHKHEYKFNRFKGCYYLNASALDSSKFLIDEGGWVASPAGYCVMTLTGLEVHVERRTIEIPDLIEDEDETVE
jgi:predicted phosphodiesterase